MKRAVAAGLIALGVVVSAPVAGAASRADTRTAGPERVLLVGDSITINYQDVAAAELGARGYQVIRAGIAGASLLDADICGGAYAKDLLKMVDPDVVVFENNGNSPERVDHLHMFAENPVCAQLWYNTHLGGVSPAGRGRARPI